IAAQLDPQLDVSSQDPLTDLRAAVEDEGHGFREALASRGSVHELLGVGDALELVGLQDLDGKGLPHDRTSADSPPLMELHIVLDQHLEDVFGVYAGG